MRTLARYLEELQQILGQLPLEQIENICDALYEVYRKERVVYVFGNGGSAALASHMVCDLGKGTHSPSPEDADLKGVRRLKVLSVTDNVPLITAWANDTAYESVFAEQIENFIQPGDAAFAISGSGNSPNVLRALQVAAQRGAVTIGLTGGQGGKMLALLDHALVVSSHSMQQIEDVHVIASHLIFLHLKERILGLAQSSVAAAAG